VTLVLWVGSVAVPLLVVLLFDVEVIKRVIVTDGVSVPEEPCVDFVDERSELVEEEVDRVLDDPVDAGKVEDAADDAGDDGGVELPSVCCVVL